MVAVARSMGLTYESDAQKKDKEARAKVDHCRTGRDYPSYESNSNTQSNIHSYFSACDTLRRPSWPRALTLPQDGEQITRPF
jgi:hypothetical protein